jgi:cobalt/nickel transport system ATP-binding protein
VSGALLSLSGAGLARDGRVALAGLDLEVRAGESLALLGANGSGKSSLLGVVAGVFPLSSGRYLLGGAEVDRDFLGDPAKSKPFHKRVGLLFQNPDAQLFCPSVREEVAFGPAQLGLGKEELDARVADCLRLLGIEALADRVPYHLSEGEKRRVALAAVLALNPEILLLDEPFNSLDPRTRRFLSGVVHSLLQAGKTVIASLHDLELGRGLFSRAVVLSEAHQLARDGAYEEVIADGPFLSAQNII